MKRSVHRVARFLRKIGDKLEGHTGLQGTWIDVGAHRGESTLHHAVVNPGLKIFAFEPNLSAAAKLVGRAPNYFVIPLAVSEENGVADFNINSIDAASSLLRFNATAQRSWIGGDGLRVDSVVPVPTIRLDTFMQFVEIDKVDFLKVDAQGADLAVVRSAGARLTDIFKITLEVDITKDRLYEGSASRNDVVTYLEANGFVLANVETQSLGQEENLTFVRK